MVGPSDQEGKHMAEDEEETEGMTLAEIMEAVGAVGQDCIAIVICDEIPQCANPECGDEAVGMVNHPFLGLQPICLECLEMVERVTRMVVRQEGDDSTESFRRATMKAKAAFN